MTTVAIWMGHSGAEAGASGLVQEDDITRAARTWAVNLARSRGFRVITDNDDMTLRQRIQASNAASPLGILEFHGNSGGGRGIEGWYSQDNPAQGQRIAAATIAPAATYGFPIRGTYNSRTNRLGRLGILDDTQAPALLIELLFVDSQADVTAWRTNGQAYVEALTTAWLTAITTATPEPKPLVPTAPNSAATPTSIPTTKPAPVTTTWPILPLTGVWDGALTERLQVLYGIKPDRIISSQFPWSNFVSAVHDFEFTITNPKGSQTIYAMQVGSKLPKPDGLLGPKTLVHWQTIAHTPADSTISTPSSQFVIWLQKQVNANRRPF